MNGNVVSVPYENFEEGKHLIGRIVQYKTANSKSYKMITEVHHRGIVVGSQFYTYAEALHTFVLPEGENLIQIGKLVNKDEKTI